MACVHLRVQSSHSPFDGAITPLALAKGVKARGMTAAALTDTATTAGVVQWKKAAEKVGVRPIFGAIVWLAPENRTVRDDTVGMLQLVDEPGSVLLLAETTTGWENLSQLCSLGSRDVLLRPRVTWTQIAAHAEGLHALLPLDHGRGTSAVSLDACFPGRWGTEVFDHGEGWEPARRTERASLRSPYGEVGTNAVRYLDPLDVVALHALRCTGLGANLDAPGSWVPLSDQAWLLDEAEMRARLGEGPVDAAVALAERLTFVPSMKGYHFPKSEPPAEFSAMERWAWLQDWFPLPRDLRGEAVPYPEGVTTPTDEVEAWFAHVARRGLEGRLAADPGLDREVYTTRLEREIAMILEMKFPAYLLIVAEFIVWAKESGVPVGPGRGSVAGSLVAWAMRITEVDSIRFTLLFERFLNPARVSMPDVDVDFGQALRESVIEHMRERYGRDHVGQISNFGTFKPKSAIKDMLRGLRVRFDEANRITGAVDDVKAISVGAVVEETPSLHKLVALDPVFRRGVKLASMLVRAGAAKTDKPDPLSRQRGVHAAGVVVAPRPLSVYAPVLHDAESGRDVLAVDMDGTETLGLIKFDFLGLKTLDVIEEALDHVQAMTGMRPNLDAIPLDDPAVFSVLAAGEVQGLFQVESDGMKGYLQQLQPDHIEDVIAMLALYRPGPLGSGMVEDFIERKRGRQEVVHLHPLLEPVLRATYGVLVYQESILQAAQVLAGFSLGHADLLRRAIGKKKPEEIAAQKKGFVEGCLTVNGIPEGESRRIFGLIEKFAEYGFNRSHSAAYGLITYRTAWLKAHHRVAFLAACASWEGDHHDALAKVLDDATRVGIGVLPPDVHRSGDRFTVEPTAEGAPRLRYGLGAIKGVGETGLVALRAARVHGPFADLGDLATRTGLDRGTLDALVASGALDGLVSRRDEAGAHLRAWQEAQVAQTKAHASACKALEKAATRAWAAAQKLRAAAEAKAAKTTQGSLFAPPSILPMLPNAPDPVVLPDPPAPLRFDAVVPEVPREKRWTWLERLSREQKTIGVVLSGSALMRWGDLAEGLATHRIGDLAAALPRVPVAVCARIRAVHEHRTKTGSTIGFVLLTDATGSTEVTVFGETWRASKAVLKPGTGVLVRGTLDRAGPTGVLIAGSIEDLDAVRARGTRLLRLGRAGTPLCADPADLDAVLLLHPGSCPVRVNATVTPDWKPILESRQVSPDGALFDDLERMFGEPGTARAIV